MTPRVFLSIVIATLSLAAPPAASAAAAPTRPEYVERLERICKPGAEATRQAVRGVRADVKAERLGIAASKFARAHRIFAHTVKEISVVQRPAEDARTLARWYARLGREELYLEGIAETLRASNIPGFQRVSAQFCREGNRANNVIGSFGFNYCSFQPSRFV